MSPKRLLVIGNGMAAERFVDELLVRDGAEHFDITIVGEEPFGAIARMSVTVSW